MLWAFSVVHALNSVLLQDYTDALEWSERTLQIPTHAGYWAHAVKAAALAQLGRLDEAKPSLQRALDAKPDLSIAYLEKNLPTKQLDGLAPYLNGLRACGLE